MNQVKLSDRVRPNSEVAAWVHTEIQALENALDEQALADAYAASSAGSQGGDV